MRNLIFSALAALATIMPGATMAQGKAIPLQAPGGALLDGVALNAGAASLTFYIGKGIDCGRGNSCDPTSATDNSTGEEVIGYTALRLEFDYTHANNGAITLTCTDGSTRADADHTITSSSLSSGTYTLDWSGVVSTASLTTDKDWSLVLNLNISPVLKCVLSHGGTPNASDLITVRGWLIAE